LAGCGSHSESTQEASATGGRKGAQLLVERYAQHIGARNRAMNQAGDISFGASGFTYDQATDLLVGRVFVNHLLIEDAPPAELANYRKVAGALNDPKIGGMFDRGGGQFALDEKREGLYLIRNFRVKETTAADVINGMDALQDVSGIWTTRWLYRVSMIAHGHQPAPTRPVTRSNPD
jgi:hypothetical protein